MRIGLMPRRNINQPRQVRKTVVEQLGLPAQVELGGSGDGVESLFDAEALKAFESRLSAQKNQTAEIHQGVTAMQGDQDTIGLSGLSVAVENNGQPSNNLSDHLSNNLLSPDPEQFYATAPDPNLNFRTESYTPSWRTLPRRNAK